MLCKKCRKEIPDGSRFCSWCGVRQECARKPKNRGNGQGSVYQLPNKKWIAIRTVGFTLDANGHMHRTTRSKSGFRTKKEALDYLPKLEEAPRAKTAKFKAVYDAWLPTHRAGKSTIDCYRAAIRYFAPVWNYNIDEISIDDLQACVDDCPKGRRTRENMKAVCGLIYKYAIPRRLVTLNMAEYIIISGEHGTKDALPDDALQLLEAAVGRVRGADYVLCQCYLGFRPSEFLALDATDYDRKERAFVGGAKTDAGKNRLVTVSPKIQPIIDRLVCNKIAGPVFCTPDGRAMSLPAYRDLFYAVLEECGIDNPVTEEGGVERHKYTPHSCRHTFATLMKRVQGADRDKLELMGHTSAEMLRHYQDVSFDDLRRITDAI